MVDAVPVHPGAAFVQVRQLGRDRARGLAARELQALSLLAAQQLHARKFPRFRIEALVQQLRQIVRVDVDDHAAGPLAPAACIRVQIASGVIGSSAIEAPSGASASLMALAMAAGAPR